TGAGGAVYGDVTVALEHDAAHHRQAEPGPHPATLRREEGFEDPGLDGVVHADTLIDDSDLDVLARAEELAPFQVEPVLREEVLGAEHRVLSGDLDVSALRHGVSGV